MHTHASPSTHKGESLAGSQRPNNTEVGSLLQPLHGSSSYSHGSEKEERTELEHKNEKRVEEETKTDGRGNKGKASVRS